PIQQLSIPAILRGENVLLIAPTGTGKTLAATLPVLDKFLEARSSSKTRGISILYVTPLRALNRDLLRRLEEMGRDLDIKIQVRHGDTPTRARSQQAKSPPDMLITTPETLQSILIGKRMKEHLRSVRWVIVDEVHELATDERGVQLSIALERLQELTGVEFQRIGLSATIGEPERIGQFLAGTNRKISILRSDEERGLQISVGSVTPITSDNEEATRLSLPVSTVARARKIRKLIEEHKSTLVFTNTREHAEALASQLSALGLTSLRVHHGSLSRELREEAEKEFQEGKLRALICTSSLELGIDIGSIDFIIQYTSPRETTRLVQRIGRSGHTLGGTSRGIILTISPDDILESAVLITRAKQGRLERPIIHEKALDVLAHQIIGILLQQRRMTSEQILTLVHRSYPFRELEPFELDEAIHQLEELRLVRKFGDAYTPRNPKAIQYYFENLSVIPDVQKYTVFDFFRKRRIGTLDQDFVARRCVGGAQFILHGQTWKVISVDEEKYHVEVEPAPPSLTAIPGWEGDMIPVQLDVAHEVGRMRRLLGTTGEIEGSLEPPERERAESALNLQRKQARVPSDKLVLIEGFENSVIVHTCAGNLVNEALSNAMAALFGSRLGSNIATQVDQYRFALIFPRPVSAYMVAEEFQKLTPNDLEAMINDTVEASDLFAWKHWHVLRRIGAVSREAEYKARQARLLVDIFKKSIANRETRRELFAEKLDVEGAKKILGLIASGEIELEVVQDTGQCTPLALPLLDRIVPHGLLRPAVEETSIIEVIKSRLLSTRLRLLCINCGKWDGIRTVENLQEQIRCPKCRSTLIAATYLSNDALAKIIQKKLKAQRMQDEEEKEWLTAYRSAGLLQTYGKRAGLVLAARGVGPTTATRILRNRTGGEDDLYLSILRAEREFERTRMFWD
ncbi:MAG TPA: DEAD/DEAH box helicase, partial [Candidatus Bathyarchaeia archaeon]|nr:DEAD/DEAH box helicase [Candidatus Bathyarchaeia archaeon]